MKLEKKQRDQPATLQRHHLKDATLMNTATRHYPKVLLQKIKTILRLLPGLQTMQFGIGM